MLTDRDLVEANAFSRRRLVNGFVLGAAAGEDPDPPRPLRAVVVGAVVSGLMVGGALIARFVGTG